MKRGKVGRYQKKIAKIENVLFSPAESYPIKGNKRDVVSTTEKAEQRGQSTEETVHKEGPQKYDESDEVYFA